MIKIVMGSKGSGKTKKLIEAVKVAIEEEHGNVVVIEKDDHLRYDVDYRARLISSDEYAVDSFDKFTGFVSGLVAGNYDITAIFVDSVMKICKSTDLAELEQFITKIEPIAKNVKFFITVSMDAGLATDTLKPYLA